MIIFQRVRKPKTELSMISTQNIQCQLPIFIVLFVYLFIFFDLEKTLTRILKEKIFKNPLQFLHIQNDQTKD